MAYNDSKLHLWLGLGLLAGVTAMSVAAAHAADSYAGSYEGFYFAGSLSTATRYTLYGLILLGLCLSTLAIPDVLLLACIFAMPIVQFTGVQVALTALQCV